MLYTFTSQNENQTEKESYICRVDSFVVKDAVSIATPENVLSHHSSAVEKMMIPVSILS